MLFIVVRAEFVAASRAMVVDETDGTITLTVRSLGNAMDEPVDISYSMQPGTATGKLTMEKMIFS